MLNFTVQNENNAQYCMVWMHGLGADAADMQSLVTLPPFKNMPIRHVFIDAPYRPVTLNGGMTMRAWYDIYSLDRNASVDLEGISHSRNLINSILDEQLASGFKEKEIILAGFSQGGAMALNTALYSDYKLGGIIALSAYLPFENKPPVLPKNTPIFMGYGQFDTVVNPMWTRLSEQALTNEGFVEIMLKSYPIDHSICIEEINDMLEWINYKIIGV